MNDLEGMLRPLTPLSHELPAPGWGFNDIARWQPDERQPYVSKFETVATLYAIFSPAFPSPQRTWIQLDRPARYANVLLYRGCALPALKDHLPMSDAAAALADGFQLGDDEDWKKYFDDLGKVLSGPGFRRIVVPYLYCFGINGKPGRSTLAFYLEDEQLRKGLGKLFALAAKERMIDENHIVCVPYTR